MSELSDLLKAEEARAAIGDTGAGGSPPPVPPPADLSEAAKKKLQRQIREAILSGYRDYRKANKQALPNQVDEDTALAGIVKSFDFQNTLHTAFSGEGIHSEGSLKAFEAARQREVNETIIQPQNRQQKDERANALQQIGLKVTAEQNAAKQRLLDEAFKKVAHQGGAVTDDEYAASLAEASGNESLPMGERIRATRAVGSHLAKGKAKERTANRQAEAKKKAKEREDEAQNNAGLIRQDKDEEWLRRDNEKEAAENEPGDPITELRKKREEIKRGIQNRNASNEKTRHLVNSQREKKEIEKEYKAKGVHTDEDKKGGSGAGFGAGVAGYRFIRAAEMAIGAGGQLGGAVNNLIKGVDGAIVGLGSGLVKTGETMLGFILSPFGKSGAEITKAFAGIGKGLLSAFSAGTEIAGGIAKLVVSVGTGLIAGIVTIGGGILGGLAGIGGGFGGIVAGAGIGAMLAGTIVSGIAGIGAQIGGAVGQIFGAIGAVGKAFGDLVSTIGDVVNALKNTVTDLIQTGVKFAAAATNASIQGGLSAQGGGLAASMAQVITGDPNGMAGFYSNYSNMSPYQAQKMQTWGLQGTKADDPTTLISGGYNRFQQIGKQYPHDEAVLQQRFMLDQVFGPMADKMGQLFTTGSGSIKELISIIKQNQPTPGEMVQDNKLSFQLEGIGLQLDKIKMKFLSDLMPAIESGVQLFQTFFKKNEAGMLKSLTEFGTFMSTKFPTYLRIGIGAAFDFAKMISDSLPKVFTFLQNMLIGLVTMAQRVAGVIAPLVAKSSPSAALELTKFAGTSLFDMGIVSSQKEQDQINIANAKKKQIEGLDAQVSTAQYQITRDMGNIKAGGKRGLFDVYDDANSAYLSGQDFNAQSKLIKDLQSQKLGLQTDADAATAAARALNPTASAIDKFASDTSDSLAKNKKSTLDTYDGVMGTSQAGQDAVMNGRPIPGGNNTYAGQGGNQPLKAEVNLNINQQADPAALDKLTIHITDYAANQFVLSAQHSN